MNRSADQKILDLMDAYGADLRHWPADAALALAALTGNDAVRATRMMAEANALDRVLARASVVPVARQLVVADRIMAAVHADASAVVTSAVVISPRAVTNVVALPHRPRPQVARTDARNRSASAPATDRRFAVDWPAAAALAAALVVGIGIGLSGTASPTFQAVAETVGVNLDRSVLALNDDPVGTMAALDDEDVL